MSVYKYQQEVKWQNHKAFLLEGLKKKISGPLGTDFGPAPLCYASASVFLFFLNSIFLRWTKDRRAMRVMSIERKKWMNIRPLPTKKQMPLQFDVHT